MDIEGIREPGVSFFGIEEPAGQWCDRCKKRPGMPHICPGDGQAHRHGMIHTASEDGRGPLQWLCASCYVVADDEWTKRRKP